MDVDKEISAADRRVQLQIDASAREALIRLGFDPDAEARAELAESWAAVVTSVGQVMVEIGEAASVALSGFARSIAALEAEQS